MCVCIEQQCNGQKRMFDKNEERIIKKNRMKLMNLVDFSGLFLYMNGIYIYNIHHIFIAYYSYSWINYLLLEQKSEKEKILKRV